LNRVEGVLTDPLPYLTGTSGGLSIIEEYRGHGTVDGTTIKKARQLPPTQPSLHCVHRAPLASAHLLQLPTVVIAAASPGIVFIARLRDSFRTQPKLYPHVTSRQITEVRLIVASVFNAIEYDYGGHYFTTVNPGADV
jgi:hypothetical protein